MKKIKRLCLLLLCLGVVGGAAACDMSMLSSMMGGASVDSQVESTDSEGGSSEILDNDAIKDKWNEALKVEKFNNVKFSYWVVFSGQAEENIGTAYLDGDKVAYMDGNGDIELMGPDEAAALRNVYVNTVLAVLNDFTSFSYEIESDTFVSNTEIVYTVNVLGVEAKITATDVRVHFNGDGNISHINCNMKQDFVENGTAKTLEMQANFTFADYGAVVLPPDIVGGNPDSGNPDDGEKPEEDVTEVSWDAAFEKSYSYSNYTMTTTTISDYNGDVSENTTCYFITENAVYSPTYGRYYEQVNGESFWYFVEDGEWVKEPYDGNMMYGSSMIMANLTEYQKMGKYFSYDEETNSYYAQNLPYDRNGTTIMLYELRVYIENGMVVEVYSDADILKTYPEVEIIGRAQSTITFTDFNETVVNLPTIDEGMSSEEKAWREAFNNSYEADNYSLSVAAESCYTTGTDPVTQCYTENFDGDVLVLIQESSIEYYVKEGDTVYRYRENGGIWTKSAYGGQVQFRGEAIRASFGPFEDMYESFTYDETEGCYVARNITIKNQYGNDETYYVAKISIENGYLASIYVEGIIKNGDGEAVGQASISFTFFDRHTTLTRVPVIDARMQVTEAEWIAAMELAVNADNITASMNYIYDYDDDANDSVSQGYMKLGGNATFQWGDDYQQAYANENGVNYAYNFNNGVWTKYDMEMEVAYTNYRMASVIDPIRSLYSNFTYNAEKGVYTCAEAMADAGNGTMIPLYNLEVGFENGKVTYIYFEMDLTRSGEKVGCACVNIELWNYGTTVVDLPKVV